MSFSGAVKDEILALPFGSLEQNLAEVYGIIAFDARANKLQSRLTFDNEKTANRVLKLLSDYNQDLFLTKSGPEYCVHSKSVDFAKNLFKAVDYLRTNCPVHLLDCVLRGIFLSCGTVTDPQSDYRLEFCLKSKSTGIGLLNLIASVKVANFKPKLVRRKKNYLIYIKSNSEITDFLTFIGATTSSMQFMQVKMLKETRNYINRTNNFETANISKTTSASAKQIAAINRIIDLKGLDSLPDNLKEVASLRLSNPYMPLEELANLFSKPITKSGINYRLNKLIQISQSL